ncbi:TRAP transporter permease [Selenihalanaerobacter shriftii]|uniref:TRAP transporter, 4TM/12TM fusion protein n=1 Tax=Selenihalanaerobacter shriftii TaxID=142842 RepID=A0A1T4LFN5_9FIRM|nr:TRAP transporter permease [Selenihalanaerobacter shriftii]SJZ53569.1 TRAP transporter, 4TM/12TM fusion protein [Selenihalanaerobacter shriftii]
MVKVDNERQDTSDLLNEFDTTSNFRNYTDIMAVIITIIAVGMSLFHLYTAGFGVLLALKQRAVHLGFILVLIFLLYPAKKKWMDNKKILIMDYILAILGAVVSGYILVNYMELVRRAGIYTNLDEIIAGIAIILVLEATRRVIGWELPIISSIFLIYAYFGPQMPGMLAHRGFSLSRITTYMFFTTEGIFGIPLGVSATYVFLFLLLGAFAKRTGLGELFIDLAIALTGRTTGGPAKAAVVSSGLMGSISGSSVANTVTTGSFTIPLMQNVGYKPRFAAAVEASASTGGQIMPPIMGAAAFIMSEFIGVPYMTIAKAAILPSILYYLSVGLMVHFEAKKLGLSGMSKDRIPKVMEILKTRGQMLIPLAAIFYYLFQGYTPLRAAFVGIVLAFILSFLRKDTRISVKDLIETLEEGARGALGVAAACACVGFIVGVTTLTGLGLKFTSITVALANGNLFLALLFTMVACTILGTGLPTTATYIVLAAMAAPALVKLGVPILAAHLFVLYFGVVADLTPPAALAAYAGAGISGSNPLKTGITAVKLAIAGFVVPFVFAYSPELLLIDTNWQEIITMSGSALLGVLALAGGVLGYLKLETNLVERGLLLISALALLMPGLSSDLIGLIILILVWFFQNKRVKDSTKEKISL